MIRSTLAAISIVLMTTSSVVAEGAKEIKWEDLIPATAELVDPFEQLTTDQLYDLETLAYYRQLQAQGEKLDDIGIPDEINEAEIKLKEASLDIEKLLDQYTSYLNEIKRRDQLVVTGLDGEIIRLAGYALPLEMTDTGVTEFFLVPYIGACIHVPPPPPNQMVLIKLDKPFNADDLYMPVWVTGRLSTQFASKELSLVDGQSTIDTGYTLKATQVAAYEAE